MVPCEDHRWREDLENSYQALGLFDETERYRQLVIAVALVEVVISGATPSFDVGQFRQTVERAPEGYAEVAYDEALLSQDGTAVIMRRQGCANGIIDGSCRTSRSELKFLSAVLSATRSKSHQFAPVGGSI